MNLVWLDFGLWCDGHNHTHIYIWKIVILLAQRPQSFKFPTTRFLCGIKMIWNMCTKCVSWTRFEVFTLQNEGICISFFDTKTRKPTEKRNQHTRWIHFVEKGGWKWFLCHFLKGSWYQMPSSSQYIYYMGAFVWMRQDWIVFDMFMFFHRYFYLSLVFIMLFRHVNIGQNILCSLKIYPFYYTH